MSSTDISHFVDHIKTKTYRTNYSWSQMIKFLNFNLRTFIISTTVIICEIESKKYYTVLTYHWKITYLSCFHILFVCIRIGNYLLLLFKWNYESWVAQPIRSWMKKKTGGRRKKKSSLKITKFLSKFSLKIFVFLKIKRIPVTVN